MPPWTGDISLGGGAHGVALTVAAYDAVRLLDATVADVTDPVLSRRALTTAAWATLTLTMPSHDTTSSHGLAGDGQRRW